MCSSVAPAVLALQQYPYSGDSVGSVIFTGQTEQAYDGDFGLAWDVNGYETGNLNEHYFGSYLHAQDIGPGLTSDVTGLEHQRQRDFTPDHLKPNWNFQGAAASQQQSSAWFSSTFPSESAPANQVPMFDVHDAAGNQGLVINQDNDCGNFALESAQYHGDGSAFASSAPPANSFVSLDVDGFTGDSFMMPILPATHDYFSDFGNTSWTTSTFSLLAPSLQRAT